MNEMTKVDFEFSMEQELRIKRICEKTGESRDEVIAHMLDLFLCEMGF